MSITAITTTAQIAAAHEHMSNTLCAVLDAEPFLTWFGYYTLSSGRSGESYRSVEHFEERMASLDEDHVHQFSRALLWISFIPWPKEATLQDPTIDVLTREVAKWAKTWTAPHRFDHQYVSNGMFIAAAIASGLEVVINAKDGQERLQRRSD